MSSTTRTILSTVAALVLAGAHSASLAQSTSGGAADAGRASRAGAPGVVSADTADDDKAIQNLLGAAQSLREAIQRMAQMPAGERRTEAIRESNEALMQVHTAMATLPSHLLLANAKEADYKKAMDKMRQASDRLYKATEALASQPAGKQRNAAVKEINTALMETNEAMLTGLQLANRGNGAGAAQASGSGSAQGTGSSGGANASLGNRGGSATATGRPGANNVDLSGSGGSGASASAGGKDAGTSTVGPTRANDIGVMDSANSRELRSGGTAGSSGAGNATGAK